MLADVFRNYTKQTFSVQNDSGSQDTDGLLSELSPSTSFDTKPISSSHSGHNLRLILKIFLLCTLAYVILTLCIAWTMHQTLFVTNPDEFCLHHVSMYLVKEVKPNWQIKLFNGTFLHENIYRQSAGPEVDAAWQALGVNYRSIVVPQQEAEQSGLRHDQVKISQEYGGGFPANIEGLHHLHCLDLLRKSLHWNYDYYLAKKEGPFINSPYIVRIHTTHCLDILRQVLMCNPDVGVLGQVWWQPKDEPNPMPFVDFNTNHRCRDYEAIRTWAEAHQLPPEKEVNMARFYEMPQPGDTVFSTIP